MKEDISNKEFSPVSDESRHYSYLNAGFDENLIRKAPQNQYNEAYERDSINLNRKKEIETLKIKLDKIEFQSTIDKKVTSIKSIHLISESLAPKDKLFLVIDELFQNPVRYPTKDTNGRDTTIKRLYDIAYVVNAPGKEVPYTKNKANAINNGLFKRRKIKEYLRTNDFKSPTVVRKSEDGKRLVLSNIVNVQIILIKDIPQQYQYLYIDKTL